jgi:hypothetical protein
MLADLEKKRRRRRRRRKRKRKGERKKGKALTAEAQRAQRLHGEYGSGGEKDSGPPMKCIGGT